VISTKSNPRRDGGSPLRAHELREAVHASLHELLTDVIDVFHLHGVIASEYDHCVTELVPELRRLQDRGSIRFVAVSELFADDPSHAMLRRAVRDDCWDVMMLGFNPLNQSARDSVLPHTTQRDIGVEVMFAVRRAFSNPDQLARVVAELVEQGRIDRDAVDVDDPLGFLVRDGGASSVVDAAYRYARHEPGCHVVLTGTGSAPHLQANVRSIDSGPLPDDHLATLRTLFGHLDHLSAN
jgi:aryl-alcohol dehydrogenase-like predicted oxidoreductase